MKLFGYYQCRKILGNLKKKLLVVKFITILLFLLSFQVQASVNAQGTRISLTMKNATLKEVIDKLNDKHEYGFLYNEEEIQNINNITIEIDNNTLDEALNNLFKNRDFDYTVINEVVVIKPSPNKIQKQAQQEKFTITGKVVNEEGEPLVGATILYLGNQSKGVVSDDNGLFSIVVPLRSGNLTVSFVGTETQTVEYTAEKFVTIQLKEFAHGLDAVKVVAYGTTSRREMAGSVTSIEAKDIKDIPSPSVANLLQGKVAGMDVTNISGAPGGGGTQLTIRGYNSLGIEAGRRFSNPLWVIDGVPMTSFTSPVTGTNSLSDLNPEVIESIEILKDASATSLYGSRAANGVIIVTTKKGKRNQSGNFSVNVSSSYTILPEFPVQTGGRLERDYRIKSRMKHRAAFYDASTNTWRYPESYEDAYNNPWTGAQYDYFWKDGSVENDKDGTPLQDSLNSFYNNSTNFYKELFRPAKILNANIQTYGGSEKSSYSIGAGYYNEEGILIGTGFNRINLMGNFETRPSSKLVVGLNNYIAISDRSRGVRDNRAGEAPALELIPGQAYELSSLLPLKTDATKDALDKYKQIQEKNTTYSLRSSLKIGLEFTENLSLYNTTSIDYRQNNQNQFSPANLGWYNETKSLGAIERNSVFLNESVLQYIKVFAMKHQVKFMAGISFQNDQYNYIFGGAEGGPGEYIHYVGKYGWPDYVDRGYIDVKKKYLSNFYERKMNSYFGRINYIYAQKYIVTASLRRDGSSVFGENNKWATFPSVAVGWNFSQESFMQWANFLDFSKIRASYGKSGNIFSNPYLAYGLLEAGSVYDGKSTIKRSAGSGFYNPDLRWEETDQFDIGMDFDFMKHRLKVTADYYHRYTHELLYKVPLPTTSGYGKKWQNAAGIVNYGFELEISYDIYKKGNDFWNISLNLAKNYNFLKETWNGKDVVNSELRVNYVLGRKLNGIYGFQTDGYLQSDDDIVNFYNSNGEVDHQAPDWSSAYYIPGNTKFVDVNGDYKINWLDYTYLGSSLPDVSGGIVNTAKWRHFDLNMLFTFTLGRDMVNAARVNGFGTSNDLYPIFEDTQNVTFWEKEGDNTDYPAARLSNFNGDFNPIQDRHVENVNYFKIKTLTIGFTLPEKWNRIKMISSVRIFFSGENLYTFTNYSGLDPETVNLQTGIDDGKSYPLARRLTVGLTIKL